MAEEASDAAAAAEEAAKAAREQEKLHSADQIVLDAQERDQAAAAAGAERASALSAELAEIAKQTRATLELTFAERQVMVAEIEAARLEAEQRAKKEIEAAAKADEQRSLMQAFTDAAEPVSLDPAPPPLSLIHI